MVGNVVSEPMVKLEGTLREGDTSILSSRSQAHRCGDT